MGEVINLRRARKQKQRLADESRAEANRAKFGRTKSERVVEAQKETLRLTKLDAHRREPPPSDD